MVKVIIEEIHEVLKEENKRHHLYTPPGKNKRTNKSRRRTLVVARGNEEVFLWMVKQTTMANAFFKSHHFRQASVWHKWLKDTETDINKKIEATEKILREALKED